MLQLSSEPKKHHYIPKCYSKNFVNDDGYVKISDLWENGKVFLRKPDSAFTAKYMYSQPVHAEGRFDNSIEHFLSRDVETHWTPIVERLSERQRIDQEDWANIVQFICSMLVRVPITFDAVVELLRKSVVTSIPEDMPSPPNELVEIHRKKTAQDISKPVDLKELIGSNTVVVYIDPHRCITSMAHIVGNIAIFQPGFSFGVPQILHNSTDTPFLTSDNPVCFYGGNRNTKDLVPYRIRNKKPFSFVFPISSAIALVNSTFIKKNGMHVDLNDKKVITEINRTIAAFSYRYVFGKDEKIIAVDRKFHNICPRPVYEKSLLSDGIVGRMEFKFGKPKRTANSWKYDIER